MGRIRDHEQLAYRGLPKKKYFNFRMGLKKLIKWLCSRLFSGDWVNNGSFRVLEYPFFRNRKWTFQLIQFDESSRKKEWWINKIVILYLKNSCNDGIPRCSSCTKCWRVIQRIKIAIYWSKERYGCQNWRISLAWLWSISRKAEQQRWNKSKWNGIDS